MFFGKSSRVAIVDERDNDHDENSYIPEDSIAITSAPEEEKEDRGFSLFRRKEEKVVEPPMPKIGEPSRYLQVVERIEKAKPVTRKLLDLSRREVADSILEAGSIPVGDSIDRVKVTTDITDRMSQKRSIKAVRRSLDITFQQIKRFLNFRRIGIDLMNHNSMGVVVRKLEDIDPAGSRTIVSTRSDGKQDSDMW